MLDRSLKSPRRDRKIGGDRPAGHVSIALRVNGDCAGRVTGQGLFDVSASTQEGGVLQQRVDHQRYASVITPQPDAAFCRERVMDSGCNGDFTGMVWAACVTPKLPLVLQPGAMS